MLETGWTCVSILTHGMSLYGFKNRPGMKDSGGDGDDDDDSKIPRLPVFTRTHPRHDKPKSSSDNLGRVFTHISTV